MNPLPRKTRKAWNEPGHAHFMTYSCFRRLPFLQRDRGRRWGVAALETARQTQDLALWAYVIMPEHVHVLLCPRQPVHQMRIILAALKRLVSEAAKAHLEATNNQRWLRQLTVEYPSRTVFRFW